jgi:hypothetical protein
MKSAWRRLIFWRRATEQGPGLVAECEAFLAGRYLSSCAGQGGRLPAWVWLSTLAHGNRADIEALADGEAGLLDGPGPAQYFARQLLDIADMHRSSLRSLQRELLVPLELSCDGTDSTRMTKLLYTQLLLALRRADRMGDQCPEGPSISEPRQPPDAR